MREEKRETVALVSGNSNLKQIPGLSRIAGVGKRTAAQATLAKEGCVGPGARAEDREHKGTDEGRENRQAEG